MPVRTDEEVREALEAQANDNQHAGELLDILRWSLSGNAGQKRARLILAVRRGRRSAGGFDSKCGESLECSVLFVKVIHVEVRFIVRPRASGNDLASPGSEFSDEEQSSSSESEDDEHSSSGMLSAGVVSVVTHAVVHDLEKSGRAREHSVFLDTSKKTAFHRFTRPR